MSKHSLTAVRSQAGFTLVELAIVMIIIGLLIGGVLKGQELVKNAQVTATVAQIKAMDAAISTFRDMYASLPGDLVSAQTRLPNCTDNACRITTDVGQGNGFISTSSTVYARPGAAPAGEATLFFVQLARADLITGVSGQGAGTASWGNIYPKTTLSGGMHVGSYNGTANAPTPLNSIANPQRGLYLSVVTLPGVAAAADNLPLSANNAANIDRKIDDGLPNTGSILGYGTGCSANTLNAFYDEATGQCGLHIRLQN